MEKKNWWVALLAALPGLLLAGQQWLEADAKAKEKQDALDSYSSYIEDRMKRDAALERALMNCMYLLPARAAEPGAAEDFAVDEAPSGGVLLSPPPPVSAAGRDVNLDDLAEEFGYEQKTVEVE